MSVLLTVVLAGCRRDSNGAGDDASPLDTTDDASPLDTIDSGTEVTTEVDLLTEVWTAIVNPETGRFGDAEGVGDVNGDGFDDVIVTGLWSDIASAELYLGSPFAFDLAPSWTEVRTRADMLGPPTRAGDVNGDGFGDVLFGSFEYDTGSGRGRAAAFYGSASGLRETADWHAFGEPGLRVFAYALSSAGDVNGDGYDDVLVSDMTIAYGEAGKGTVSAFLGSPDGLEQTPSWTMQQNVENAWFGISVAGAGDVNGDGYDDVAVGASHVYDVDGEGGRAYVYLGSASGLESVAAWTGHGDESVSTRTSYGSAVSGAGDVNGDGYDDLLVGAPGNAAFVGALGRAHVYLGSSTGPSDTPDWEASSDQVGSMFGASLAGAGDLNGDGFADVAVGAVYFDDLEDNEGRVEVFLGSAEGLQPDSAWVGGSQQSNALYGLPVSAAGDMNGDGFDDLLVGAPNYTTYFGGEWGRVWAYAGAATTE